MSATDAMQCRSCGGTERASEGYPCRGCGTFICVLCNIRGEVFCQECVAKGLSKGLAKGLSKEQPAA